MKNNKTLRISCVIICILLFIGVFIISLQMKAVIFKGVLAQVQVAICVLMVIIGKKAGFISAVTLNGILVLYRIWKVLFASGTFVALLIYVTTILLVTIIYSYMRTNDSQHEELQKQYDEIMDTKRILQEKDEALKILAYKDRMTGMYNAHHLNQKMNEFIQAKKNFQVVYFDIDNFKQINDAYGPKAGDQALMTYAERIQSFCDANHICCVRMKSDKFAMLFEEETSDSITQFIERLRIVINEAITVNMATLNLSASYGIVAFPRDGGSTEILVRNAIIAVYNVKSRGKDQSCFYSHA